MRYSINNQEEKFLPYLRIEPGLQLYILTGYPEFLSLNAKRTYIKLNLWLTVPKGATTVN